MTAVKNFTDWLFRLPSISDRSEVRRRSFLAKISLGLAAGGIIVAAIAISQYQHFGFWPEGLSEVFWDGFFASVGSLLIWFLNRTRSEGGRFGIPYGTMFLVMLIVLVSQSDSPRAILNGRTLMAWVLPIAAAPLILPPKSTYWAATMSVIAIVIMAIRYSLNVNPYAVFFFYGLAFLLWLSARALENALIAAEQETEKYRAVIASVADGIVVVDQNGKTLDANAAVEALLGKDLSALQRQNGQVEIGDRVVEFSWSRVPSVGAVAVVRDITRQIEVERAKDSLLGIASHELRTPLTAILGFADIIEMEMGNDNPRVAAYVKRIQVNVGRLKDLVNSLLDHAQIQAGAFGFRLAEFELLKLTDEVTDLMAGMARDKELVFSLLVDESAPQVVCGDFARLRQVLVNLLGNAIKFTSQGSVTVRVYSLSEMDWGFAVSDTGAGIPSARLPDIFEPFRRGSDYATRNQQGAGLGLAISRQLIELMGGKIEVRSEVGKGTDFLVTLPKTILLENEVSNE